MYEDEFAKRLSSLRIQRKISARDMSLSIGQNPGYINTIETGKALPSMNSFFYICDYLGITPGEFFSTNIKYPHEIKAILANLENLDAETINSLNIITSKLNEHL